MLIQTWFLIVSLFLGLMASSIAEEVTPSGQIERITISAQAGTNVPPFTTLYRFNGRSEVRWPRGGVAMDGVGNLYGTTLYGGSCETCGVIYRLKPPGPKGTSWTFARLHSGILFDQGIAPIAPVTIVGNVIYGTMSAGGDPLCGCGVVFKILTDGTGYQELHRFTRTLPAQPVNGSTPIGGVIVVGSNIYGTTNSGGKHGAGVLYKVSTTGSGFQVLHHFAGDPNGGPQGELLLGKDGFIYGTQFGGGKYNQGMVFRISKSGQNFLVLHDFLGVNQPGNSTDGANPEGRLAQGNDSTIYGTTSFGGTPSGYGTAWSLKLDGGQWVYAQLRIFAGSDPNDANLPHSGLVIDSAGVLYGTGAGGGLYQSGAVYKLMPPASAGGVWGYQTLYSFKSRDTDGDAPYGDILLAKHVLYGVDLTGGDISFSGTCINGCGTVFRVSP
jgi:uncharacterized repeat protein (TIGR03803 family)